MKEVHEDKNSVRFKFNAYNQYDDNYELQIHKAHLEQKLNHKILNQNALKKLKIEENLQCIQLGFGVNYWEVELKWKSGNVILGEGWNQFHFPRLFMDKYGQNLNDIVYIWMVDRYVWIAGFCQKKKCIFGLARLQNQYSMVENSIVLFHYIGECTFYMTIFAPNGMDTLYGMEKKLVLKDVVVTKIGPEVNPCCDPINANEDSKNAVNEFSAPHENDVKPVREETNIVRNGEGSNNTCQHFIVTLRTSHFDKKCHGPYCPATLDGKNQKRRKVQLLYKDQQWEMKGNPVGKRIRLGKGWDEFMNGNTFRVGERLKFEERSGPGMVFQVSKLP
ncbi:hypothetical protein POM88_049985 [Heracleum sosnowskyi]|uniref:B3 domain-containing protein n=1 Tax=Heracleum sosnowskyi TaxID=360622 RepID=A0AAD8GYV4_9APIA|nr:hypothetical protein POM88_049985 [Heracleum sosnowskyi]